MRKRTTRNASTPKIRIPRISGRRLRKGDGEGGVFWGGEGGDSGLISSAFGGWGGEGGMNLSVGRDSESMGFSMGAP